MRMFVLVAAILALFLVNTSYALPRQGGGKRGGSPESVKALSGMVGVVQNITLPAYKKMKIGEAFGKYRYFDKKEWMETRDSNDKYYIVFTGLDNSGRLDAKLKKKGISVRGVEISFYIYPNGNFGVGTVSRVEVVGTDSKKYIYSESDAKRVFDAIYANRKISY